MNCAYRGFIILMDATAETDTASVTPSLQVQDGNGDWNDFWTAAAAITAVGNYSYLIYPGATATGNFTEVDGIPVPMRGSRLTFTHTDADPLTYSIVAYFLP
tara:strand:+ start:1282 stop:1587 length:306 start_codon:yes stop_codon:yes gene_type:complete